MKSILYIPEKVFLLFYQRGKCGRVGRNFIPQLCSIVRIKKLDKLDK